MKLKSNSSKQKLRGAYYTPDALAQAMVQMVAVKKPKTILEPSCGDGIFIDTLAKSELLSENTALTAIEIEQPEAEKVRTRYCENSTVGVLCEDFFNFYEKSLGVCNYDLIVGNPPYIRYQYLTENQRAVLSKILTSHGMRANKLINAWVGFLVACVQLLSATGTIAFVIPAEILQVAYAEDLRLYLSDNLSKITLITFKQLVFPEIEQEVLVLLGEKGTSEKGIRIIEVENLDEMAKLNLSDFQFSKLHHVREKWTKYFVSPDEMEVIQEIKEDPRFARFADFGLINVGITTGNNKYFSVDSDIADKYQLGEVSLPLTGRSSHTHGIYFTEQDWKTNLKDGKRAYLVNFPETPYEKYPDLHKQYIQYGEDNGEHVGYKCSIRDRWYIIPSVWVPDAFFLRRNNLYPKFVLNRCGAVSTDTMHRMKFNEEVDAENVLLSYYNSISFAFTEICGRSYGGGVLEILPGEMGNIMLPIISVLDKELKSELLDYVDRVVRCEDNIEKALDIVDKKLLIDTLGIAPEWCSICRGIWKKLQRRRLGRGTE